MPRERAKVQSRISRRVSPPRQMPKARRALTAETASATIDSAEERQALLCNYLPPAGHALRPAWTSRNPRPKIRLEPRRSVHSPGSAGSERLVPDRDDRQVRDGNRGAAQRM